MNCERRRHGRRMVSKTAMIVQNIKHIEFNEDKKQCNTFKKKEHHSWSFVRTHTKNRTTIQYTFCKFLFFRGNKSNCYLSLLLFNKSLLTLAMIIVRSHYSSPFLWIWQSNRHFRISKQLFRWKVKLKFLQEFLFSAAAAILFLLFVFVLLFVYWYETAQPDFAIFGQIIPDLLQKQPYTNHDS